MTHFDACRPEFAAARLRLTPGSLVAISCLDRQNLPAKIGIRRWFLTYNSQGLALIQGLEQSLARWLAIGFSITMRKRGLFDFKTKRRVSRSQRHQYPRPTQH